MMMILIKEAKGLCLVYIELVMNRTSQRSPSWEFEEVFDQNEEYTLKK